MTVTVNFDLIQLAHALPKVLPDIARVSAAKDDLREAIEKAGE